MDWIALLTRFEETYPRFRSILARTIKDLVTQTTQVTDPEYSAAKKRVLEAQSRETSSKNHSPTADPQDSIGSTDTDNTRSRQGNPGWIKSIIAAGTYATSFIVYAGDQPPVGYAGIARKEQISDPAFMSQIYDPMYDIPEDDIMLPRILSKSITRAVKHASAELVQQLNKIRLDFYKKSMHTEHTEIRSGEINQVFRELRAPFLEYLEPQGLVSKERPP